MKFSSTDNTIISTVRGENVSIDENKLGAWLSLPCTGLKLDSSSLSKLHNYNKEAVEKRLMESPDHVGKVIVSRMSLDYKI